MKNISVGFGRGVSTFIGLTFIAALFKEISDGVLIIGGAALLIGSVILLVKPLNWGWLQHRGVAIGILLGSIGMMGMADEGNVSSKTLDTKTTQTAEVSAEAPDSKAESTDVAASKTKQVTSTSSVFEDETKQQVWIAVSQDAVRDSLKDPSSAEFRNVFFHAYQGNTPIVCGEVNAKNSFGAYMGYQGFLASGDKIVTLESDFADGEFAKTWNQACRR